jgi:hypothetical protein
MHTTALILPALVAVCYGAALPQSFVTGTTISAPEPTSRFVIPCFPLETDCTPRIVTIEGRDVLEPTFGFVIPPESIALGDGITETAIILPRQSLVADTTISAPQEALTFVIPCYSGEDSCLSRTVTLERRHPDPQSLGSVSRSASIPPTLPTTTSSTSSKHHHSARQTLVGSPSTNVLVWPSVPTITVTVTLITTAFTSGPLTERQVLGSPTRTVLEWPRPTVTVTTTMTLTTTYVSSPAWSLAAPVSSSAAPITVDASSWDTTAASIPVSVLTVPVDKKRQLLGKPTMSVTWC